MTADPCTRAWWQLTGPCQEPLETGADGEWWVNMEQLFHCS
jgi:L-rhamnose mutarotase